MNQKEYTILRDLNDASTGREFPRVYVGGEFIMKVQPRANIDNDISDSEYSHEMYQRQSFIVME